MLFLFAFLFSFFFFLFIHHSLFLSSSFFSIVFGSLLVFSSFFFSFFALLFFSTPPCSTPLFLLSLYVFLYLHYLALALFSLRTRWLQPPLGVIPNYSYLATAATSNVAVATARLEGFAAIAYAMQRAQHWRLSHTPPCS